MKTLVRFLITPNVYKAMRKAATGCKEFVLHYAGNQLQFIGVKARYSYFSEIFEWDKSFTTQVSRTLVMQGWQVRDLLKNLSLVGKTMYAEIQYSDDYEWYLWLRKEDHSYTILLDEISSSYDNVRKDNQRMLIPCVDRNALRLALQLTAPFNKRVEMKVTSAGLMLQNNQNLIPYKDEAPGAPWSYWLDVTETLRILTALNDAYEENVVISRLEGTMSFEPNVRIATEGKPGYIIF